MTRPELRLSSRTLRANIGAVRDRISPSTLMLVVKDDAYGHGLTWAVETALSADVDWFGSYDVRTGLDVRRIAGGEVGVFAWATATDDEIDEALMQRIDLGVGSEEYLSRVAARARALGAVARVHLKIDTGLHRNGVLPERWDEAVALARRAESDGVLDFAGVWSHIAEASDEEDDAAQEVFLDAVRVASGSGEAPRWQHLTASAASWWRPELRGSLSRIGAFCYGVRSAEGPELAGILPAATLVAQVEEILDDQAVIGVGAFDGFPSVLVGSTVGTAAGARPLLQISDTTSVVGGWPGMAVGDEVALFGPGERGEQSATTLAEAIDTVGEEILTRLTPRIRRVVADD